MPEPTRPQAIAVVGMAGRFPRARGLDGFWSLIRDGVEVLDPVSDADLDAARVPAALRSDPRYVRKATPLEDADQFDAAFFGYSPREAQLLDPQQRLFLECAWEAMEHAGWAGACAGQAVGVWAGVGFNTYLLTQLLQNPAFVASAGGYQLMVGSDKDFLATRVSYKLDLRGPSATVQTACSTSLVAVVMACRALRRLECDLALAGGVSVGFPQRAGYLYEEGMIFSPDGHCRPFDAQAKGTRAGAGAGAVVLKRLEDALQDGDTVHAVILGGALNNDGAGKAGFTAPSVEGQVEVIATAQALAGVDPRSIGYVEAHGTGTPLGDPIEIAALTQVFRAATPDVGFCRLGSLKASIGHLDAAAGVAGLIKAVLALKARELPPLVNFRAPNPQLGLERSPFTASATAAPWQVPAGAPRRAAVSSFGIGGTNAHVVLEEAPAVERPPATRAAHLLVLSARTEPALERACADLAAHLRAHPEARLGDVAWTLQAGRQPFPLRRAVVARDATSAAAALEQPQRPPVLGGAAEGGARPVAFLFSGQGSQHPRMGAVLHATEPAYRDTFDRCAALLEPHLGLDLRDVVLRGEGEGLQETRLVQPALFATELSLAALWAARGVRPAAMVGHSIGEWVAAHLAGVLSLEDALAVVAARGRLMQALPAGTMAAVHLSAAELGPLLGGGVELAAINAPGLCTVSGPREAVAALLEALAGRGVESRPLHTSHAFHSEMMAPALAPFTAALEQVRLSPPRIPFASNVTGTWITDAQATSPAYWAEHLRRAVRFEDGVRAVAAEPSMLLLEVGPGNALTSLARLTLGKDGPRRVFSSLAHPRDRRPDDEAALEAAGRLWLAGATLEWRALHAGDAPRRVPLPTYPFERKRFWVDPAPHAAEAPSRARPAGSTWAPTWARDDAPADAGGLEGAWLVLAEAGPLQVAVERAVKAAGGVPVVVEPGDRPERLGEGRFRARPGEAGDLVEVVRAAAATAGRVSGVLYLWSAAAPAPSVDRVSVGYHALVATAAALQGQPPGPPVRLLAATRQVQTVLGERAGDPAGALVLGPALSLPAEVAGLQVRAVDLEAGDGPGVAEAAAAALISEARRQDGERSTAHRAGLRWVRRYEPISLPAAGSRPLPLAPGGACLVTGGLGGIGLALVRWLADHGVLRFVLTARTPLPARDAWDAWLADKPAGDRTAEALRVLREVEARGGEIVTAAADVADEAAMRRVLDEARRRLGPLTGVIHAAGVLGSSEAAVRKKPEDVAAVIGPKVGGLEVLVRLLGDAPLELFALLGSTSAALGGSADYAAANAVLDAFADSRACPASWRRIVTVDFAGWRDVGMGTRAPPVPAESQRVQDELRRFELSPAAGVEGFERALLSGRSRVVVAPFDLRDALSVLREQGIPSAEPEAAPQEPLAQAPAGEALAGDAPGTELEQRLAAIWAELLGVPRVGLDDDFFALGGHSLLATRVLTRVEHALHARLTLRDVFEAPTLRQLAARAAAARAAAAPAGAAPAPDREELEF